MIWVEHVGDRNMSSNEIKAMEDIFTQLDIIYSQMDQVFEKINSVVMVPYYSDTYPDPNVTAYDFLTKSSIRNDYFDRNFGTISGRLQRISTNINDFLGFVVGNSDYLQMGNDLYFHDGSRVVAIMDFHSMTSKPETGSARDAAGNTYPDTISAVPGIYEFRNQSQYDNLIEYLNINYGGSIEINRPSAGACISSLTCSSGSDLPISCTAIVCNY